MSSGSVSYEGPLLKARPELGQLNITSGLPDWPRSSSDNAADQLTYYTLNQAVAWLATGDLAIVSGVSDYEAHLVGQGHQDPSISAWFMVDRDAAFYHSGEDRVEGWVYEAAEVLRLACERAAVVVSAVPACGGEPTRIPPEDFREGLLGPGLGGRLGDAGPMAKAKLRYHSLLFSAAHVRELSMPTRTTPLGNMPAATKGAKPKRGRPSDPKDHARFEAMRILIGEEAQSLRIEEQHVEVAPIARTVVSREELTDLQAGQIAERLRKGYNKWRLLHGV